MRLTSITPPGGDPVAWNPTLIAWEQVQGDKYGLGAGHWRQTVSTGDARSITFYDTLWQPRLTRTFDANYPGGTASFVARNFDVDGRQTFESYKSMNASVNSNAPGVATDDEGGGTGEFEIYAASMFAIGKLALPVQITVAVMPP